MEGVDDDADGLGGMRLGQRERLTQRGDHSAVGAVHRVQRLQRQSDLPVGRVRHQLGQPLCKPGPGADQVAVRHTARHHHQLGRAERGSLVDGATVVVQRRGRVVASGEKTAAAQAGHAKTIVPHYLCGFIGADLIDPVAPQPDGRQAGRGGGLDSVGQRPSLRRRGIQ